MSTWDALKSAVLDHQFASTKYDSYVGEKLNQAQSYVAAQMDFRELFTTQTITTTANTASYALSTDFLRIYSLVETDTNNQAELGMIDLADYDLLDTTTRGRPTGYVVDRSNVKLYPTPDAVYAFRLRYYRTPATMIAGSTPEIPVTYHHLLENYVLSKVYEREHQTDLAQYHWSVFERDLAKAKGEVQNATNDATQADIVPGPWGDEGVMVPSVRIP